MKRDIIRQPLAAVQPNAALLPHPCWRPPPWPPSTPHQQLGGQIPPPSDGDAVDLESMLLATYKNLFFELEIDYLFAICTKIKQDFKKCERSNFVYLMFSKDF
jgi:hypothetical protein